MECLKGWLLASSKLPSISTSYDAKCKAPRHNPRNLHKRRNRHLESMGRRGTFARFLHHGQGLLPVRSRTIRHQVANPGLVLPRVRIPIANPRTATSSWVAAEWPIRWAQLGAGGSNASLWRIGVCVERRWIRTYGLVRRLANHGRRGHAVQALRSPRLEHRWEEHFEGTKDLRWRFGHLRHLAHAREEPFRGHQLQLLSNFRVD